MIDTVLSVSMIPENSSWSVFLDLSLVGLSFPKTCRVNETQSYCLGAKFAKEGGKKEARSTESAEETYFSDKRCEAGS